MNFSDLLGEPFKIFENGNEVLNPEYVTNSVIFVLIILILGNIILRVFFPKRK